MPIGDPSTLSGLRRRFRVGLLGVASAAVIAAAGGSLIGFPAQPVDAQTNPPLTAANGSYERSYAPLVERVMPAVVNVQVEKVARATAPGMPDGPANPEMRRFFERFFGQPMPNMPPAPEGPRGRERGEGSGFVLRADGYIVTNAHVVDGASEITVAFQDGETRTATLVGTDEKTDLAVIKVEADESLPYLQWGDSERARVGDKVLAVGNPFGLGGTVTEGIVSATGRELGAGPYDDFLQVDAAINRGNSGGPTFNLDGQVIGINTIIFSPSGGNVGIGFAIASNLAREVTTALIEDGSVTRGWLGVGIQQVTPDLATSLGLDEAEGAIVTNVEPNGPAAQAGLRTGDVITDFADAKIDRVRALTRAVADVDPGKSATVRLWRDGSVEEVEVTVGKMPGSTEEVAAVEQPATNQPRLGLSLADLTREAKQELGVPADVQGVLVQAVQPGSPAEEKGLRSGDVILRVGNKEVTAADEVVKLVREAHERGEKSVLILFKRDEAQLFAAIPFASS